jgi:hypothetical protein
MNARWCLLINPDDDDKMLPFTMLAHLFSLAYIDGFASVHDGPGPCFPFLWIKIVDGEVRELKVDRDPGIPGFSEYEVNIFFR